MNINSHLFKLRALNGLRRTTLESQKILSNFRIEEADLDTHQELTEFMEDVSSMIEAFAIEEGIRK